MISAADFPDVFPWMAKSGADRARGLKASQPIRNRSVQWEYDECLARWEDDGGWPGKPSSLYASTSREFAHPNAPLRGRSMESAGFADRPAFAT